MRSFLRAMIFVATLAGARAAVAEPIVGLSRQNELVLFDSATPGSADIRAITGLQGGEQLIGLDYRPANGLVYTVSNFDRIFTVDLATGAVNPVVTLSEGTVGLGFGFDFNPVADRLRVVSDAGQNLRINVDTGAVILDGILAYAGGDVNAGATPRITASAYTNSVRGATSTTLFNLDTDLDVLVRQVPPNDGTLNTVGSFGVDGTNLAEFDISGFSGIAYASMVPFGMTQSMLYTIDLNTGSSSLVGLIGPDGSGLQLRGLTVVPEPSSWMLAGLGLVGLAAAGRRRRSAVPAA